MSARRIGILLCLVVAMAGCGPTASPVPAGVTIYAASSLKAVLVKAKAAYESATHGVSLVVTTDSSAALEAKIELGAPADVLLAADMSNPQKLADKGLAAGSVVPFAGNLLTIIVPAANQAEISAPVDLARAGVKVIAAGDAVPITKYATTLVTNLAREPGYPAGFADAYAANVVSREDNVAAVVAKVELGEGDAAIVYLTDARASSKVAEIAIPASDNVPATYGGVVVSGHPSTTAGAAFLAWFAGPAGQAILASFGFLAPT